MPATIEPDGVEEKMEALLDAGVRVVVNLMEPDERDKLGRPFTAYEDVLREVARTHSLEVAVHRFPIPDLGVPDAPTMQRILETIRTALERDLPVYVHCWGGVGRTGTVVGCWLIESGRSTPATVLEDLAELRRWDAAAGRTSPETAEQQRFVKGWKGRHAAISGPNAPDAARSTGPLHSASPLSARDRFRGALLGLAVGDALGTTVEFRKRGTFKTLTTIVGGGPFGLEPGQWTDDTAMALCLADSLVECDGFDPSDQAGRYLRWWREGCCSCTGSCFDIGSTVRTALAHFEQTGDPFSGSTHERSAGNGSLMRLAPVVLAFAGEPGRAIHLAGESSRVTHGAAAAVDACRYFAGLLIGALGGGVKATLLAPRFEPMPELWAGSPLTPVIDTVASGSFRQKSRDQIRASGYVVESLEAALWAFRTTTSFREGALAAVNLGDDADTTGAIYGQLAGAFYGASGIPAEWLTVLAWRDRITALADRLLEMSRMGR